MRSAIIFELPVDPTEDQDRHDVEEQVEECGGSNQRWWTRSQDELRALAPQESTSSVSEEEARQRSYQRSKAVQIYVRKRADGICEGFGKEAPFVTPQGRPYLEAHHVRRVSDGGPDHPRWVIALCPNCHRRIHHGRDGKKYNTRLIEKLETIEEYQ